MAEFNIDKHGACWLTDDEKHLMGCMHPHTVLDIVGSERFRELCTAIGYVNPVWVDSIVKEWITAKAASANGTPPVTPASLPR